MTASQVKALLEHIEPALPFGTRLHAILDGARDSLVAEALDGSRADYRCLFKGRMSASLRNAAPFIVDLESDPNYRDWLLGRCWGQSWGLLFASAAGLDQIQKHFRRCNIVLSPQGKRLYFRYYDPRVWRVYAPTCNHDELAHFFGPVEAYWAESGEEAEAQALLHYERDHRGDLQMTSCPLEPSSTLPT